ncbi:uncharacterized protein LOC143279351 [Babylonia areolata]|uniref:uncharacterized protein LOC143279351 n=1 Tax=Babylonia areolata TaxID=304850 RepID=UPI003FD562D3
MKLSREMTEGRVRYLLAGWAILETMLFGGIINGWASLVFVLKEDGLYAQLCPSQTLSSSDNVTMTTVLPHTEGPPEPCKAQDGKLNLWFTIAAALRNIFGIVIGFHIFKFGTRSARLCGWFLFGIGALMMAFADESNPWLVLPSLLTMAYGGVTLLLTNVQISCLFPRTAGVIVTLVSGAFDFSAATQLVVKMLHESELVSRLYSYVGLAGLHTVMILLSTVCFFPKDMVLAPDDSPPPTPPERPSLRQRRDSLYDWSEISVHSNNHGFRCTVCEDEISNEEQKEQQATNHSVSSEAHPHLPEEHLNGKHCINEQEFTTLDMNRLNAQPEVSNVIEMNTSSASEPEKASSLHTYVSGSHQPPSSHAKTPCFHSQGGRMHDVTSKPNVFSISETPAKAQQPSGIDMTNFRGKFVSIIDVGRQHSKLWEGEGNDRCQQEAVGVTESTMTPEGEDAVNNNGKVRDKGHRKVTLQLDPEDDLSPRVSNGEGAREETEDVDDGRQETEGEGEGEGEETMFLTLKSCLRSCVYWTHVLWFSFNALRLVAFFGFINTKLTTMFSGDKDKVSHFTNVQAYFILTIMAVCWISGAVYDWQTSLFQGRKKSFARQVLPAALPLALTSLLGVAISACWMIDTEASLYVMFALLVFYNAFIFGIAISFQLRVFPERYFGILNGLLSIIGGAFCFLQYAIFIWYDAYPDGPFHAEIFMMTLVVLSLVHPLYIVFKSVV